MQVNRHSQGIEQRRRIAAFVGLSILSICVFVLFEVAATSEMYPAGKLPLSQACVICTICLALSSTSLIIGTRGVRHGEGLIGSWRWGALLSIPSILIVVVSFIGLVQSLRGLLFGKH